MGISTHILDTALGRPAADVPVSLSRWLDSQWSVLSEAGLKTDADGRARQLLPEGATLAVGLYRVRFETAAYYEAQQITGLYPFVEIAFEVRDAGEQAEMQHYHIPLLLTANGYTTYRGS
jgi:5-hydroxyisourate hydrolase